MAWDAAILAGGQARRFDGQDKSALPIAGRRLLDHQLAALTPLTPRIVIVGGSPERFAGTGVQTVPDLLPGIGPLGGLYTALEGGSERILVLACDLPFVTTAFLQYLLATGRDADATVPRTADGLHPLCAAYAKRAAPKIRRLIDEGVRQVQEAISSLRLHLVEGEALAAHDPDGRLLHNINTPDDYARAIALIE
ncbi:MAG TPA: molybdenum cofactor guanylyltransferase [Vicinamibacterales bacterium]|nr:molybdenum cofactor guanylyltransferase [Vicinamibacterales bacterium]